MAFGSLKRRLGLLCALGAAGALIGVPVLGRDVPAPVPDPPAPVASTWPGAAPRTLPALLPGGDAFDPLLALDGSATVGYTTALSRETTDLVVLTDPATRPRLLQTLTPANGDGVHAFAATADRIFWLRTTTDAAGTSRAAVWVADRAGGDARLLTDDGGPASFANSGYDLQVADGRLYWAAAPPVEPRVTEVRSVSVDGGAVEVRTVPGSYALTAWPWLTNATGAAGGPHELLDARTGERVSVAVPADVPATCTPTWCRVVTSAGGGGGVLLQRPDGRDGRRIAGPGEAAALGDVALLDRFEILALPLTRDADNASQRLSIHDLRSGRTAVVAPVATGAAGRDGWLWWATGDQETRQWHLLDLRTLG